MGRRKSEIWVSSNQFLKVLKPHVCYIPNTLCTVNGRALTRRNQTYLISLYKAQSHMTPRSTSVQRAEEFLRDVGLDLNIIKTCPDYRRESQRVEKLAPHEI